MGSGLAAGSGSALFCSDASRFPGAGGTSAPGSSPAHLPPSPRCWGRSFALHLVFHPLPPSVAENPGLCHGTEVLFPGECVNSVLLPQLLTSLCSALPAGKGCPSLWSVRPHQAESHAGRWVVQVRPGSRGSCQEFKPARAPSIPEEALMGWQTRVLRMQWT